MNLTQVTEITMIIILSYNIAFCNFDPDLKNNHRVLMYSNWPGGTSYTECRVKDQRTTNITWY
jgi:uncharacterized protein (DUF427 family)